MELKKTLPFKASENEEHGQTLTLFSDQDVPC